VHVVPEELAARLATAAHVVALTGSGISAESGVPTFRDAHSGLWAEYSPEQLATPEAFARNPKLVWDWYAWRRELVANAEPNAGHHALVTLAERVPRFTLITQNVDGLHQRAGSRDVIEFHGNLARFKCSREGIVVDAPVHRSQDAPPRCPQCGAYVRPDVVWFGEMIPPQALERACAAVDTCDVFLSIGTSSQVYPAAGLAEMAQAAGAWLVEVNTQPTPQSRYARYLLSGAAGQVLPALAAAVEGHERAFAEPD
jgi:NAD-dependent protein deacetylase/lipoamidase